MENKIVKSILIGLIAGVIIGLTGENWDMVVTDYTGYYYGKYEMYDRYGTSQAIIGGIIVSLLMFLRYNNKLEIRATKIVKSVLIGLIAGVIIGLTGENWDMELTGPGIDGDYGGRFEMFDRYGTFQAIIGGIIVSLLMFLRYNKK